MNRRDRPTRQARLQEILEDMEERAIERRAELDMFESAAVEDDAEVQSHCPVLDGFYRDGGAGAISRLSNFAPREINSLWSSLAEHVGRHWNVGRGRRTSYAGKDVLFMLLVVLKNSGSWECKANVFEIKKPSFIKLVTEFTGIVAPRLYDDWVATKAEEETMHRLVTAGHAFVHYPCALYATDVTFQQSNRPIGTMKEAAPYYSAKHKLHGYKVEVSASPRGFAINCTNHAHGSTSDITIFRINSTFHQSARVKRESDARIPDNRPLYEQFPDEWAVLTDKGYQGLGEHVRCIHSKRGTNLPRADERVNANISSDRIVVENFFGRLCSLWRVCSDKFRWCEDLYDEIFQTCFALTNFHVAHNPMCEGHAGLHWQNQRRLKAIGESKQKKRMLSQEKYGQRKRLRHRMRLDDLPGFDDDNEDSDLTQY